MNDEAGFKQKDNDMIIINGTIKSTAAKSSEGARIKSASIDSAFIGVLDGTKQFAKIEDVKDELYATEKAVAESNAYYFKLGYEEGKRDAEAKLNAIKDYINDKI